MSKAFKYIIGSIPFILTLIIYSILSYQQHIKNPEDRLMPRPNQLINGIKWSFSHGSIGQSDAIPIVKDTIASLRRLLISLSISGIIALVIAIGMQNSTFLLYLFKPFIVTLAKIPPLALLPILLLWVGISEISKITLIIIGITPYLCLHLKNDLEKADNLYQEKLFTIKLPILQKILFIDLLIIWPSFLHQMQTCLGSAWLFLLVAETVGANYGLGYRIFVVRRYLAMDIIFVYVAWITLLSVFMFILLSAWQKRYEWYYKT